MLLATALGIALAVVVTFPLALRLGTHVLEDGSYDPFQFLWNLWWVRESLVARHTNPFFSRAIFYPIGVPLLFHTFSFPLGVLSIPLQLLLPGGVLAAHNLLILLAPAATFLATALLAREVTGDPWAALAAGLVAAVNPVAVWFAPVLYLDCTYLIAAALWAWWCLQRTRRLGWAVVVVAFVGTLVFTSQEYAMMTLGLLALDTTLRAILPTVLGLRRAWWPGTLGVWGVLGIGLAALASMALGAAASPPPPMHLLLGSGYLAGFVAPPWLVPPATPFWTLLYLGTVPIGLAAVAALRGGRRAAPWLVALVATLAMALGPHLHLHHPAPTLKLPPEGLVPSGPVGPYALALQLVPLLRWFRAPYRWVAPAQVVLAVVVAIAVAAVRAGITAPARRRACTVLLLAAIALGAGVDTYGLRAPIVPAAVPRVYEIVRDGPERGAVLDLPSGFVQDHLALFSSLYMYYQTRHGRPLLDGTVSRTPPGATFVWQREITDFSSLPYVEWVVVHRDLLPLAYPSSTAQLAAIERLLATEGELVARDGATELYHLRTFRPDSVR
ncbi:MAG: hypothetical protein ACREQL_06785 [Candidatus Binatia bacterium]